MIQRIELFSVTRIAFIENTFSLTFNVVEAYNVFPFSRIVFHDVISFSLSQLGYEDFPFDVIDFTWEDVLATDRERILQATQYPFQTTGESDRTLLKDLVYCHFEGAAVGDILCEKIEFAE